MTTLTELWRAVFPGAAPAAEPPQRDVAWVRVLKPRVPAFDALEQNDLAILPVRAMRELAASGSVEATGVVDAVAHAGGSAVLLVGSDSAGPDPSGVDTLRHAVDRGLGAFSLTDADVPALERSAIGYLVNHWAELERQAQVLEAELERLALEGRDLDAHAAAIARFLGRAVAIERPRGKAVAVHVPAGVPQAAQSAAAYLADSRRVSARFPLPDDAAPVGALALLGPSYASERDRAAIARIAGLLALELRRGPVSATPERLRGAAAVPSAGPPWVSIVARQILPDRPASQTERERVRAELRRLQPTSRLILRGDSASLELRLVAALSADDPDGLATARQIAELCGRPVAVSQPFAEPEERAVAEAQARATLEAIEVLHGSTESPPVARAGLLPAYRLLGGLHDIADGERQARALLAPLLSGRPLADRNRLSTLRAILDAPVAADAAHNLGIHRNTLRYRVARLEAASGWDLADPDLRLALGIALRIGRFGQSAGPDASRSAVAERRERR